MASTIDFPLLIAHAFPARPRVSSRPLEQDAYDPGDEDHERLRNLAESPRDRQRDDGDDERARIHDGAPAEHERGAGDGTRGCGAHAVHEGTDALVPRPAAEVR